MTDEQRAELDRQTTEERRAQGLPPERIEDPGVLAKVARMISDRRPSGGRG